MGCVWLSEAWIWLALQQCPEVVWKCGCTHTARFCVHCRVAVWSACVMEEKPLGGCLGNKGFPRPACLQLSCHLSLSSSLPASLFPSPDQSSSVSHARTVWVCLLGFCCGLPFVMTFPFGRVISMSKHPLLGVKTVLRVNCKCDDQWRQLNKQVIKCLSQRRPNTKLGWNTCRQTARFTGRKRSCFKVAREPKTSCGSWLLFSCLLLFALYFTDNAAYLCVCEQAWPALKAE